MTAEQVNTMFHARIRDLAMRRGPKNKDDLMGRIENELNMLRHGLGHAPALPRTPLNLTQLSQTQREDHSHQIWQFESRPGFLVPVHIYVPIGVGPHPAIVLMHDPSVHQSREVWRQAFGVSFAHSGFVTLILPPPGRFETTAADSERANQGEPNDPFLVCGCPWAGAYSWDAIRLVDALESFSFVDRTRVGILGEGMGGWAAAPAFALDDRIKAIGLCFNAESWESLDPAAEVWQAVPGLGRLGDVSDLLSLRAPAPVCLIGNQLDSESLSEGMQITARKLRHSHKVMGSESSVHELGLYGPPDLNRRAREKLRAFFEFALKGELVCPYSADPKPVTDGRLNPAPSRTLDPTDPELMVSFSAQTHTLQYLLASSLLELYPEPLDMMKRLVSWAKFGRVDIPEFGDVIQICDESEAADSSFWKLPVSGIDLTAAIHLGLSVPEFFAQILHLSIPGGPEGWESVAVGGDTLSSVFASVKQIVTRTDAPEPPTRIEARGPVASLTAVFLKWYRPDIVISSSHTWSNWQEVMNTGVPELVVPMARYAPFLR